MTLVGFFPDEVSVPSDLARLFDAALLPTLLYGTQFFIRDIELNGICPNPQIHYEQPLAIAIPCSL